MGTVRIRNDLLSVAGGGGGDGNGEDGEARNRIIMSFFLCFIIHIVAVTITRIN
jgi:hypothetical protein